MLEAKKDNLTVSVEKTKAVGDVVVGLCFPTVGNCCSLNRLKGGHCCKSNSFPTGAEEVSLCYSLYLAVQQALCGDPLAVLKTKVGDVECLYHNGMFGINWKVKGTGSAVRKSLGIALKVLDPVKHASSYMRCVKHLGGSSDKETFNYVADSVANAVKKHLHCVVVGNINVDQKKLNDMLDVLSKKHVVSDIKGTKTKPSKHDECDHSEYASIKTTGWHSAVVADYIQYKVKGLVPLQHDKELLVLLKPAQWETIAKKVKSGVKDYASNKYTKVGEHLPALFGYLALSSGALCASDVRTAINSKLTTSMIEDAINKAL